MITKILMSNWILLLKHTRFAHIFCQNVKLRTVLFHIDTWVWHTILCKFRKKVGFSTFIHFPTTDNTLLTFPSAKMSGFPCIFIQNIRGYLDFFAWIKHRIFIVIIFWIDAMSKEQCPLNCQSISLFRCVNFV